MASFSERYGYIKPADALIVECMPLEVKNTIYNCLYSFSEKNIGVFDLLDKATWKYYLYEKECEYDSFLDDMGYACLNYNLHARRKKVNNLLRTLTH